MHITDVLIIGGGPCGMAVAKGVSITGAKCTIVERDKKLGGILNQCIHNGFGLQVFNEELTGPEYARRWENLIKDNGKIETITDAFVDDISPSGYGSYIVTAISPKGLIEIEAKAVVMALGCRERPAGAIMLKGDRPSGIFTAGTAQKLINIEGKSIGKKVAILGSGDIGLIMARRLTCEGTRVVGVYEIMPTAGGLARNVTQCIKDFDIPLKLSTTVTRVVGKDRVEGIYVAPVNEKMQPVKELEKFVRCDVLLLSVGLIPENEIADKFNLEYCNATGSFAVDEFFQTSKAGLFCAGNVLHVNDLVDNVSREGQSAGFFAGMYAQGKLPKGKKIEITFDDHIKYTAPKYIYKTKTGTTKISFRVNKKYIRTIIKAISDGKDIATMPCPAVNAGEMQTIEIDKSKLGSSLRLEIQVME